MLPIGSPSECVPVSSESLDAHMGTLLTTWHETAIRMAAFRHANGSLSPWHRSIGLA